MEIIKDTYSNIKGNASSKDLDGGEEKRNQHKKHSCGPQNIGSVVLRDSDPSCPTSETMLLFSPLLEVVLLTVGKN